MRKTFSLLSLVLAFCLVVMVASPVSAISLPTFSLPNPSAVVLTGADPVVALVTSLDKIPGAVVNGDSMPLPFGHAKGDVQFMGSPLQLSGLQYSQVKVCFPITNATSGWTGKVGFWTGKAWQMLTTSISPVAEASYSLACATTYTNGTYALLTWIDPSVPLTASTAVDPCSQITSVELSNPNYRSVGPDFRVFYDMTVNTTFSVGTLVGYTTQYSDLHVTAPSFVTSINPSEKDPEALTSSSITWTSAIAFFNSLLLPGNSIDIVISYDTGSSSGTCTIENVSIPGAPV